MSDKDAPGSSAESNPEPLSRPAPPRPEEEQRPAGDNWFDRLRAAVGLRPTSMRAEIEEALEEADPGDGGGFTPDERAMLANVLALRDLRVEDIMVPRADVYSVEIGTTLGELLVEFRGSPHSRMPVYRETLDDPVGMVHLKDLLAALVDAPGVDGATVPNLRQVDLGRSVGDAGVIRDVLFVPPSMPVASLFKLMQSSRTQLALVIDEYGGTDGLVSIEDAIEAIVGDITDEHDAEDPAITAEGEGVYVADARASLEDVAELVGELAPPELAEEIDTVGGLVFSLLGRIPMVGESLVAPGGQTIVVLDADTRRVKRIRLTRPARPREAGEAAPAAAEPGLAARAASGA